MRRRVGSANARKRIEGSVSVRTLPMRPGVYMGKRMGQAPGAGVGDEYSGEPSTVRTTPASPATTSPIL